MISTAVIKELSLRCLIVAARRLLLRHRAAAKRSVESSRGHVSDNEIRLIQEWRLVPEQEPNIVAVFSPMLTKLQASITLSDSPLNNSANNCTWQKDEANYTALLQLYNYCYNYVYYYAAMHLNKSVHVAAFPTTGLLPVSDSKRKLHGWTSYFAEFFPGQRGIATRIEQNNRSATRFVSHLRLFRNKSHWW